MKLTATLTDPLAEAAVRHRRPYSVQEAATLLASPTPVWQLRLDGMLTHANYLALWLWGVQVRQQVPSANFLSQSVFDIFAQNAQAGRLPIEDNRTFWIAKFRVESFLLGQHDGLGQLRQLYPELAQYYDIAQLRSLEDVDNWEYVLKLRPPYESGIIDALTFRTRITVVEDSSGQKIGFVAEYEPLSETRDIISKTYEQIQIPEERYVAIFVDHEGGAQEQNVTERSPQPAEPEGSGQSPRRHSLFDRLLNGGIFRGALFDPQGAAERLREEIAEQRRISETPIFSRADSLRIMEGLFGAEGVRKIQEEDRAQRVRASVNRVLKSHYDEYGTDEEKKKFYREELGREWHPEGDAVKPIVLDEAAKQRVRASVNRVLKSHYDEYGTDEEKKKFYREELGREWHPDEGAGKRSDPPPAGDDAG